MGTASKYWHLVSLDISGDSKIRERVATKEFFQQQFPELVNRTEVLDTLVQSHLLALLNRNTGPSGQLPNPSLMAQRCLRCFISNQIRQVCVQLELQFGRGQGFTRRDLFPLVLDDTLDNFHDSVARKTNKSVYKPLAVEILETFEPQKASLSTWTTRKVKQHKELNTFLLEHGVYLVSNWAILNDTNLKQVSRILSEFHHLTPVEIKQACFVLETYHAIYRRDRLKRRQAGIKSKCPSPTKEQLEQIATLLSQKAQLTLTGEETLIKIQELAELLREYRIYVRTKVFQRQKSLDEPDINQKLLNNPASSSRSNEQEEFSQSFNQQFQKCLKKSIEYATQNRFNYLERKKPEKAQKFLIALELFHCNGQSMGKIAPLIGLKSQFEVTRLLKLREFRQCVAQKMLEELPYHIFDMAGNYQDPETLKQRTKQIETALEQQITTVIQEAAKEAHIADSSRPRSLFVQHLCRHLNSREK